MFGMKTKLAAMAGIALAVGAGISRADTITVTDVNQAPVVAGPFAGDVAYTYDVDFSATANVINPGDGFMIADFGVAAGYSLTLTTGAGPIPASFAFDNTILKGAGGLNGQVAAGTDATHDGFAGATTTATIDDSPSVLNALFLYTGPQFTGNKANPTELTLVLYTANLHSAVDVSSIGVDHSADKDTLLSVDSSSVSAPAAVPLPSSYLGGGVLLGLLGAYRLRKAVIA
jgi:hypothetical protein